MRLLHTDTFEFEEFFDNNIPRYAILSHRWGKLEDEVSFQDFLDGKKKNTTGYSKMTHLCDLAKSRDLEWVWIDTCCIDKRSSAELSEAINSMFRWYENAAECYVYMSDVQWPNKSETAVNSFRRSNWFSRGWTLQELLAPKHVLFFDQDWRYIGEKRAFRRLISEITGIANEYLAFSGRLFSASVATRMSWASRRETSRCEDMAYCLLGIFDINMPLLYGEQSKAFTRLQHEIIRTSHDDSVFAWKASSRSVTYCSIFATHPSVFRDSKTEEPLPLLLIHKFDIRPYSMTNYGLQYHVPAHTPVSPSNAGRTTKRRVKSMDDLVDPADLGNGDVLVVRLGCYKRDFSGGLRVACELHLVKRGYFWERFDFEFRPPKSSRRVYLRLSKEMTIYLK